FVSFFHNGLAQRVFREFFNRSHLAKQTVLITLIGKDIHNLWFPLGNGTCLIKDDGIQMVGIFKSIASFVKNTIFSTTTSTDHDSGRRCQSQGTRTSNNQDGNGNLKGENKALAHEQIPKEEGHNCDNHNRWDKDTSHTV